MNKYLTAIFLVLLSIHSRAEEFSERIRITGFRCDNGKAGIHLRSLEKDRILYLAKNLIGEPKQLSMLDQHCKKLIDNLSVRFVNQVLDISFRTENFSATEAVEVSPRHPCRPGQTKCDDETRYVDQMFKFLRIEATIDDYRFFREEKVGR